MTGQDSVFTRDLINEWNRLRHSVFFLCTDTVSNYELHYSQVAFTTKAISVWRLSSRKKILIIYDEKCFSKCQIPARPETCSIVWWEFIEEENVQSINSFSGIVQEKVTFLTIRQIEMNQKLFSWLRCHLASLLLYIISCRINDRHGRHRQVSEIYFTKLILSVARFRGVAVVTCRFQAKLASRFKLLPRNVVWL